ncbi:MAG: hypothetical protein GTO22_18840 [Gemmatimonadales bacterium]|nr:hypothetical protein [Gemmatimonadales bacterium]
MVVSKLQMAISKLQMAVSKLQIAVLKLRIAVLKVGFGISKLRKGVPKLRFVVFELRIVVLKLGNAHLKLRNDLPSRNPDLLWPRQGVGESAARTLRRGGRCTASLCSATSPAVPTSGSGGLTIRYRVAAGARVNHPVFHAV